MGFWNNLTLNVYLIEMECCIHKPLFHFLHLQIYGTIVFIYESVWASGSCEHKSIFFIDRKHKVKKKWNAKSNCLEQKQNGCKLKCIKN